MHEGRYPTGQACDVAVAAQSGHFSASAACTLQGTLLDTLQGGSNKGKQPDDQPEDCMQK